MFLDDTNPIAWSSHDGRSGPFGFAPPSRRPLWRLLVVAAAPGWAAVEAPIGISGWALFGAAGALAAWGLLIAFAPDTRDKEDPR